MSRSPTYMPTRKSPSDAKLYDVGGGEMLTSRQIANKIGTTPATIRSRWFKGWRGESLMLPPGERRNEGRPRTQTAVVAYQLSLRFGRKVPSVAEIMDTVPMDETTAQYWRNAIRIAIQKSNTPKKSIY